MLKHFQQLLYIQLSPDRLTVRNPKSGDVISEIPEIAISAAPQARIVAVGAQARQASSLDSSVRLVNPFAHPRSLMSDFTTAQEVLKSFVKRLPPKAFWQASPAMVIHPLGEHEGGLTQVELRALHELAFGAGAASVSIWQGRPLTDTELLAREFPHEGQLLSAT
ncbi:rod shape-determining protein [Undibacterium sp. TJN19]|uniref:rod shape-determining protein n=1 Tax=Undibacterium sp. TJN19 TaxID=3413055 RepID=UPI003BF08A03